MGVWTNIIVPCSCGGHGHILIKAGSDEAGDEISIYDAHCEHLDCCRDMVTTCETCSKTLTVSLEININIVES